MNIFYKNRYDKFIANIRALGDRQLTEYVEVHHIVPKCLKGSNDKSNLITLRLREHFLAHWMLWKAYPNHLGLASAFLQMVHKNNNIDYKEKYFLSSRIYEKLKTDVYAKVSIFNTDKVYVKDSHGNTISMSKDDYANQEKYKFHTTGKVTVLNKKTGKREYISTAEYHNNKENYVSNLSGQVGNPLIHQTKFRFINNDTNEIELISKQQARELNKKAGYKKFKQKIDIKIPCLDNEGNKFFVSVDEYRSNNELVHLITNTAVVRDTADGTTKKITLDEYYQNQSRYMTSTKGKVLARNKQGQVVLVDKSLFVSDEYSGITKGLILVKDINTGKFIQITKEEYQKNKDKYVGPNQGKVNARNKLTGEMKQIPKDEYDQNPHIWAGASYGLFKIKNKETGDIKLIDIWQKHLYSNDEWCTLSKKYKLD